MRFFTLTFLLPFCVINTTKAQNDYVDNLRFNLDGNDMVISYTLKEIYPLQYYMVGVETSIGNDLFTPKPNNLNKDAGFVETGGDKTIIWKNAAEDIQVIRRAQNHRGIYNDTITIELKIELYRKPPLVSVVETSNQSIDEWAKIVDDDIEVYYELPVILPSQYYFTHLKVYLGDSLIRPPKDSISGDLKRIETLGTKKSVLWKGAVKDLEAYDENITFELNVLLEDRLPNVFILSNRKNISDTAMIVNDSIEIHFVQEKVNPKIEHYPQIFAVVKGDTIYPANQDLVGDVAPIKTEGKKTITWVDAIPKLEQYKGDVTIHLNLSEHYRPFKPNRQAIHYGIWGASIGVFYYGDVLKKRFDVALDEYLAQPTFQSAAPYYTNANKLFGQYRTLKFTGIVLGVANSVLFAYRLSKNKERKANDYQVSKFQLTAPQNSIGLGITYQF